MTKTRTLTLALKGIYFDQIVSGQKQEEFRLTSPYWAGRLEGRDYDRIVLTRGYPPKDDLTRRIEIPWRGCRKTVLTHPHFGPDPVEVYAIRVAEEDAVPQMTPAQDRIDP
jgi:hypothetical protein